MRRFIMPAALLLLIGGLGGGVWAVTRPPAAAQVQASISAVEAVGGVDADAKFARATAVRRGDLKFILQHAPPAKAEKGELFDLARDPGETTDLASRRPDDVRALKLLLKDLARSDDEAAVKPAGGE